MNNKLFCNRSARAQVTKLKTLVVLSICFFCAPIRAVAGDAPQWMHALVNAPLPAHDEKTDAVLLYSETTVNVISADKIKTHMREAYRILRPDGRGHGIVRA